MGKMTHQNYTVLYLLLAHLTFKKWTYYVIVFCCDRLSSAQLVTVLRARLHLITTTYFNPNFHSFLATKQNGFHGYQCNLGHKITCHYRQVQKSPRDRSFILVKGNSESPRWMYIEFYKGRFWVQVTFKHTSSGAYFPHRYNWEWQSIQKKKTLIKFILSFRNRYHLFCFHLGCCESKLLTNWVLKYSPIGWISLCKRLDLFMKLVFGVFRCTISVQILSPAPPLDPTLLTATTTSLWTSFASWILLVGSSELA